METYHGHIKEAANRQRSGTEIEPEIIKSISSLQFRLTASEKSLAKLQLREDKIIEDFDAQLVRYQTLVLKLNEEA